PRGRDAATGDRRGVARTARRECPRLRGATPRQTPRPRTAGSGDPRMSTGVVTPIRRSRRMPTASAHVGGAVARWRDGLLAGLAAAALIVPLAAVYGGYFPTAW